MKLTDINISCFYACKMRFRALESLFNQQCVFDFTLLIFLKTTSKWWSMALLPFGELSNTFALKLTEISKKNVFTHAKYFSERKNHFSTNNVFLTCFSEINRNINILIFYAGKMLFRALESLFDQQGVFHRTLLISLKTNVFHFQMG